MRQVTCRYKHCQDPNGKKMDKAGAVQEGSCYYHRECFEKKETKQELYEVFRQKGLPVQHSRVELHKAIDKQSYSTRFVKYVVYKHIDRFQSPALLPILLRDKDIQREYEEESRLVSLIWVNKSIYNNAEVEPLQQFKYKKRDKNIGVY